jgi:hypothetical protein
MIGIKLARYEITSHIGSILDAEGQTDAGAPVHLAAKAGSFRLDDLDVKWGRVLVVEVPVR